MILSMVILIVVIIGFCYLGAWLELQDAKAETKITYDDEVHKHLEKDLWDVSLDPDNCLGLDTTQKDESWYKL